MIRNFYQNSLENTKIRKKLAEKSKYSVNTNFSKNVQDSLMVSVRSFQILTFQSNYSHAFKTFTYFALTS